MDIKRIAAFVVLVVVIAFVLAGGILGTQSNAIATTTASQTENSHNVTRTLSVTGIASAKASPDLVTVSFAVEAQNKTAQRATSSNANVTNLVIEALKDIGVSESEISTSYYNVYPVYEYVEKPVDCIQYGQGDQVQQDCPTPVANQILVGYKAVNGIQVQSAQLDMAGQWIDAAVQAGANRVDSVYFSVSPDRQNAIRFGLISDAVSDAHNKAMAAARPLGMEVVDVLSINLDSYSVIYQKRGYEYAAGASSPSTPIIPGTDEISASIHATFEIAGYSVTQVTSNATISASVNEEFQITLDSNPSTGYRWLVTSLDEAVVRLVNDEYIPPGSSLVGASGKQVLTFEALKEGQISIKMEYARPWDPQTPEGIYYVDVMVSANP